jgi:predicted nucleic acid-binding protein
MMRIFLDSSVLFSAIYSSRGHSRDLLLMAAREEVTLVISQLVIEEVRRNLIEISPQLAYYLDNLIDAIPFEFVRPSKHNVVEASKYVELKDAAIIAAAKKAGVDLLVSLDKKHILGKPKLAEYTGCKIITPKEAITMHIKD